MQEAPEADAPGLMVLVIEDVQEQREGLSELLTLAGLRVVTARNGFEAMRLVVEHRPDVILMDLGLPGMDGYELVRAIRDKRPDLPAVAVSAYARADDRERARAAGFIAHIAKPIDPLSLVRVLATSLSPAD